MIPPTFRALAVQRRHGRLVFSVEIDYYFLELGDPVLLVLLGLAEEGEVDFLVVCHGEAEAELLVPRLEDAMEFAKGGDVLDLISPEE